MTPCPVHGQVSNYEVRETGWMLPSSQRHTCAPHTQQQQVANAFSSYQVPFFIKKSVSCILRSYYPDGILTDSKKVDLAAELGIPNVPRGVPGSTKGISTITNFQSKKAEELLGLTLTTPLKEVVAESVKDFKARGYPGFTA